MDFSAYFAENIHMSLFKKTTVLLLLGLVLTPSVGFAADPPTPSGASAEVLERKFREETSLRLLEKPVHEGEIEESEKPSHEGPDSRPFFVRKIYLSVSPAVRAYTEDGGLFDLQILKESEKQAFFSRYENRKVTLREIRELNQQIEAAYRLRGYFAVIYLPSQRVENQELHLEVVVARMGDLHIEGQRYFSKKRIQRYWRLRPLERLRYDKIQASLRRMNENPDRVVRSILKAGKEPGKTDVYLQVQDQFPLHAGYSFDNQGVKVSGHHRHGFTARNNNLLGLDDILLVGTSFGQDFGALFFQHVLPVSTIGTKLITGFSHAQVTPQKEFAEFGINGISQTYSAEVRQDIFVRERSALNARLGFAFKEKRTKIQNSTTVRDRLRVLHAGAEYQRADKTGFWRADQEMSFGLSPHGDRAEFTSSQGETSFVKYGYQFRRTQKLPWGTQAVINFEGQLTPDKLTPQEQFFLGGADTVRGYPESDYGSDQAALVKLEYLIPSFFVPEDWTLPYGIGSFRNALQWVTFLDYGYGYTRSPLSTQDRSRSLLGIGGGVRLRLRQNIYAGLEWGFALAHEPLSEVGRQQLHFRLQCDV